MVIRLLILHVVTEQCSTFTLRNYVHVSIRSIQALSYIIQQMQQNDPKDEDMKKQV